MNKLSLDVLSFPLSATHSLLKSEGIVNVPVDEQGSVI